MGHPTCAKCQLVTLGASKNVKFRLSWNSMKFDGVTRFRETIPTVKSVSSSEIYENSGFSTEITVLPFSTEKWKFLGFYKKSLKNSRRRKNRNKWHFSEPKWRGKVTGREIGGRRSCWWSAVVGSGPTRPHALVRGRSRQREMTCVAARR